MRPFPNVPFDRRNATAADTARQSRAFYRLGPGGRGVVYINAATIDILRFVDKAHEDQFTSIHLAAPETKAVIRRLRLAAASLKYGVAGSQRLFSIAGELKRALQQDGSVVAVDAGPGRTIQQVLSDVLHEFHHANEVDFTPDQAKTLLTDLIAHKAGRTLVEDRGYPDDPVELASEIGSHLQGDPTGASLDLMPEQASYLWRLFVSQYPGVFNLAQMRPKLAVAANEELKSKSQSSVLGESGTPQSDPNRKGLGRLNRGVPAIAEGRAAADPEQTFGRRGGISALEQSAAPSTEGNTDRTGSGANVQLAKEYGEQAKNLNEFAQKGNTQHPTARDTDRGAEGSRRVHEAGDLNSGQTDPQDKGPTRFRPAEEQSGPERPESDQSVTLGSGLKSEPLNIRRLAGPSYDPQASSKPPSTRRR